MARIDGGLAGTCGWAVASLVGLLLQSCAVGPDYHRPTSANASGYVPTPLPSSTAAVQDANGKPLAGSINAAQSFTVGRDISAQWWTLFGSQALNELIAQAFAANPTIDAARATLRQTQENVYAQRGFFFPTLQASYTGQRSKLPGNTASSSAPGPQGNGEDIVPAAPAQPVTYTFHTAELTVGFVPDVFGLNRRQVESLQAQADAARFQLEAAYVTLASNIVAAAIQEASIRAQLDAVQTIIDAQTHALGILQQQLQQGYVARIDVATQQSALAQARAQLPPLQKQLEQTRDLLRVLCGSAPDHTLPVSFTLDSLQLPASLPLSLPSTLINQRPDVRAAEAQVRDASAQVGVAVANRLPQFAISGDAGGSATQLSQLFSASGTFWDIIGNAAQPLFAGGTLLHRQRAAQQGLQIATAQYRSTVLTALQNVADVLHALYSDGDALQTATDAAQAARLTLELTQHQQQAGYVDSLTLLNAQQADQQAAIMLVQARAARLGDTAALFQALGGGWWNRSPRPSDTGGASRPQ